MESQTASKCTPGLIQARWRTVFKIMCSRFLAKHSAFRRAANNFDHEQMSFRPMHATSFVGRSKRRRHSAPADSTNVRDEVNSKPPHAKPAYAAPRIVSEFIVCATRHAPDTRYSTLP